MKTEQAKLVTFGKGGDHVDYSHNCCGSGYGTPENPHAADPATHIIPNGTPVIDKRPAVDLHGSAVIALPMVNVDLEPGEVSKLDTNAISPAMRSGISGNQFGDLLNLHESQSKLEFRALDYVDLQTYITIWRQLGARIGRYQNNTIIWE